MLDKLSRDLIDALQNASKEYEADGQADLQNALIFQMAAARLENFETRALQAEHQAADLMSDFLRRHNDALDYWTENFELQAENDRLKHELVQLKQPPEDCVHDWSSKDNGIDPRTHEQSR